MSDPVNRTEPQVALYRGQWVLYWREDGQPKRRLILDEHRQPVRTKGDADRRVLEAKRTQLVPRGELIADLVDKYLADKKGRLSSYETMEYAWKRIGPSVRHLRPEHITREWCQAYIEMRRGQGVSDGTIRKDMTLLSAACFWSSKNSPALIEMPPEPDPKDLSVTKAEARRLLEAARVPHVKLFIALAIATAGRASAVLEITWDRIDWQRQMVDLGRSVGNKKRARPPLTTTALVLLKEAQKVARTDYVIEYGGERVKSIKKAFGRTAAWAGLEWVTPNVLRHSAAIWMVEGGRPMAEVSQFIGHSSTKVTEKVYARFSPEYLRKASSHLEF